ncbi:MAG: T9SS type A sorting domain-containing protein, partial [Bacteroidota bacterium]
VLLFIGYNANAQVVFSDDFESGSTNWTLTGAWGLTTAQSYSASNSLTDSPSGNYLNNVNSTATMATGVDLSAVPSASLSFWAIMSIESGFDYMYVDVSTDDFVSFTTIATFDTEAALTPWVQYTYDLGGFTGNSNVKVRFHFVTDVGYVVDGMYIDDFEISTSTVDNSPPLIIHNALPFFEGSLGDHVITAQVIDFSGINATEVRYDVDGTPQTAVAGALISGNLYEYTIPAQTPGAWVEYTIYAQDAYTTPNEIETNPKEYIAGNHIIRDNGVVDFYTSMGPASASTVADGAAVKVSLGNTDLVALCLRNYTDNSNPNNDIEVHVWADNAGLPGADVITPFMVTPEATLSNTSAMTRIDLRSYSAQLSGLTGAYYIGFIVPSGKANTTITQPGSFGCSYYFDGSAWSANPSDDYHFRAITSLNQDIEGPLVMVTNPPVFYEATLLDITVNATIMDMTGVASTTLSYLVDGAAQTDIPGTFVSGNDYTYTIPAQLAGAIVKYWIKAVDTVTPTPYESETDTFIYIAGNYFTFDNINPNYYAEVNGLGTGYPAIAKRIEFAGTTQLVTALIRNYYTGVANDNITVHILSDDGTGMPGAELITPFTVTPEANAADLAAWTAVDLRPYSAQLSGLLNTVYIGFETPSGTCTFLYDTLGGFDGSFFHDGASWVNDSPLSYHIRAITDDIIISVDALQPVKGDFNVFPNPNDGKFTIYVPEFDNNTTIAVYNLVGEIIIIDQIYSNFSTFDMSDLTKGVYIVNVNDIKKKLIIE